MRLGAGLAIVVYLVAAAQVAMAVPTAYYNPTTGNIRIKNDWTELDYRGGYTALIISRTGKFTREPGAFASVPGAAFDSLELPFAFIYLRFPQGEFEIGNVVVPGTPASDLFSEDMVGIDSFNPGLTIISVPEPVALTLAAAGVAFLGNRRRWVRHAPVFKGDSMPSR